MVKKMVDLSQASSLEGSTNTMISSTLKQHTNAHTVFGKPILNVFERFLKGSLRGLYERSIYERTFLSEPIGNHATCTSNELSNVNHAKNKPHKHYRVFRRDREPSRIPVHTRKSSKKHCNVTVIKQGNKAKFLSKGSGTITNACVNFKTRCVVN